MKKTLALICATAILGSLSFSMPAFAAKTASSAATEKHNQKINQEKAQKAQQAQLKEQKKQTKIMEKNSKK